jgi:hypothetical protein
MTKPSKLNLTKEEFGALIRLRNYPNIIILKVPTSNGMIIMNIDDYNSKIKELLLYRIISLYEKNIFHANSTTNNYTIEYKSLATSISF